MQNHISKPILVRSRGVNNFTAHVLGTNANGHLSYAMPLTLAGCNPGQCEANVRGVVAAHGGEAVVGWSLWSRKRQMEAVWTVVWKKDDLFTNVTPQKDGVVYGGLFLPDSRFTDNPQPVVVSPRPGPDGASSAATRPRARRSPPPATPHTP